MKLYLNYLQGQRTRPQILAGSLSFVQLTHWWSESKSGITGSYITPIYVTISWTVLALSEKAESQSHDEMQASTWTQRGDGDSTIHKKCWVTWTCRSSSGLWQGCLPKFCTLGSLLAAPSPDLNSTTISTTFDIRTHSIQEGNIFLSVAYSTESEVLAKPGKIEIFFIPNP